ncbi:DNA repair protein XRCC4 [Rhypophila decipiens]
MGGSPQIFRIARTDDEKESYGYILGQVTATGGGSKRLSVKLLASEGDAAYFVKLKHDRISDLRVSNSPCSPDEWEKILKAILLNEDPVEDDIEAGAEVESGKTITITVRRQVQGISQRLGSIALKFTEAEVDIFDWCGTALQERTKLKEDLASQAAKTADLESRVTDMKSQLDELIQAKKDGEKEILEKMCRLLNEKKVKIRQQQRLLNSAKIDADTKMEEDDDEEEEEAVRRHVPLPSRPGKRKSRRDKRAGNDDDESSDDGFEKMDVDDEPQASSASGKGAAAGGNESADERATPEVNDEDDEDVTGSEPEGTDDDDDDDEPPIPPPKREVRKKTPAVAAHKGKGKAKASDSVAMHTRRRDASTPPASSVPVATPADDDETESDDEL